MGISAAGWQSPGVADYRFLRSDQDTTDFTDLQSTDPEVERCTLQGEDDTDIQITDYRTLYDVQITEVQMGDYGSGITDYRFADLSLGSKKFR